MASDDKRTLTWRCPDCGRKNEVVASSFEDLGTPDRKQFVCACVRETRWHPRKALKRIAAAVGGAVEDDFVAFFLDGRAANIAYWPSRNPRRTILRVDARGLLPGRLWIHPRRFRERVRAGIRGTEILMGQSAFDTDYRAKEDPPGLVAKHFRLARRRRVIRAILKAPGEVRLNPRTLSVTNAQFLYEWEPVSRLVETAVDLVELLGLDSSGSA